ICPFADLLRRMMVRHASREGSLRKHWPDGKNMDDRKLKTLFIMNIVSGLWSYGNQTETDKAGCVFGNEQNDWHAPPVSVLAYFKAKIGCCTDYACLTKSLLDHEGIENRLTAIPGHIFNEVRFGEHWYVV